MSANSRQNIVRVKEIDLTTTDYEPGGGFFIRSGGGGQITYLPASNKDDEVIVKTIEASAIFNDPEYCKKVFKAGTTATDLYAGFGI